MKVGAGCARRYGPRLQHELQTDPSSPAREPTQKGLLEMQALFASQKEATESIRGFFHRQGIAFAETFDVVVNIPAPASFTLIATISPSPGGYFQDSEKGCTWSTPVPLSGAGAGKRRGAG